MGQEKIAFIHIGPHKTATTSIQKWFLVNRNLLQNQNLYIPEAGTNRYRESHHNLAWEIKGVARFLPEYGSIRDLLAELKKVNPERFLLSSEEFSTATASPLRLISPLRKLGYKIVTIRAIRHQLQLLNSTYNQVTKSLRQPKRFASYINANLKSPKWNYLKSRAPWKGLSDLFVDIPYTKDIVARFYEALDINMNQGTEPELVNSSRGPAYVEICRILSGLFGTFGLSHDTIDTRRLQELIASATADLAWDKASFRAFDQKTHDKVVTAFQKVNERFAKETFGKPWEEALELPQWQEQTFFHFDELPEDRQAEVTTALHEVLKKSTLPFAGITDGRNMLPPRKSLIPGRA